MVDERYHLAPLCSFFSISVRLKRFPTERFGVEAQLSFLVSTS
jgi:hypothetical protein